jgi:hypothetical protein
MDQIKHRVELCLIEAMRTESRQCSFTSNQLERTPVCTSPDEETETKRMGVREGGDKLRECNFPFSRSLFVPTPTHPPTMTPTPPPPGYLRCCHCHRHIPCVGPSFVHKPRGFCPAPVHHKRSEWMPTGPSCRREVGGGGGGRGGGGSIGEY